MSSGGFALALTGSWAHDARARPSAAAAELPPMPIRVRVAFGDDAGKTPAVESTFIDTQIDNAQKLFSPFGVRFESAEGAALASGFMEIETRADRDRLAAELASGVVNVFFVASLRDVDKPALYRMGVTWRQLQDLKKKYIIVAGAARPTTLAHELGHFFGLDHTSVKNNLMSYDRDGGTVFLDERQGRTIRQHAEFLYRSKALVPFTKDAKDQS